MAKAKQLVRLDGDFRGLLRALNKMDEIAKVDMKQIASSLAERGANYAKGAASRAPYNERQAEAVADSIKINSKDRAPSFSIGGNRKVGSSAFSAGYVIMGNEFGSKRFKQFPRRSGNGGRNGWWLYRAMSRFQPTIAQEWLKGYEKIVTAWKASF